MKLYEFNASYCSDDSLIDYICEIEKHLRNTEEEIQGWVPGWTLKVTSANSNPPYIDLTFEVHGEYLNPPETEKKTYYSALIPIGNSPSNAPYSCGFLFNTEEGCRAYNHNWKGRVVKVEV